MEGPPGRTGRRLTTWATLPRGITILMDGQRDLLPVPWTISETELPGIAMPLGRRGALPLPPPIIWVTGTHDSAATTQTAIFGRGRWRKLSISAFISTKLAECSYESIGL